MYGLAVILAPLVHVRSGSAIDQQAEQLGTAIKAARIHQPLTLVDQMEIQIGDHDTFAGAQWLVEGRRRKEFPDA